MRRSCILNTNSIRAWRGLRYNAVYAAKLKAKQARKAGQQKTKTPPPNLTTSANPFSVSSHTNIHPCFIDRPAIQMKTTAQPIVFGLGDQIFGNPAINISHQLGQDHDDDSDAESDHSSSSEDSLITAMASTRVADSFWAAAPSYPAIYLSTVSEYIPQPSKAKVPVSARIEDPVGADGKAGKDAIWALETYENSLEIDNVFDRFTKRVGFTGEQCIRWVSIVDDIWTGA